LNSRAAPALLGATCNHFQRIIFVLQVGEEGKIYVPPKASQRAAGSDGTAPKELLKDLKAVLPPSAHKRASGNKTKYLWVGSIK
jgi:hypothetical protein